jgi:solute carrier family 30 (zinc transporter), member 2
MHSSSCNHSHEVIEHPKEQLLVEAPQKNSGDELHDHPIVPILHADEHSNRTSVDDNVVIGAVPEEEEMQYRLTEKGKKIKNINLEAAYIHILTDIILSIGVIISALIIYFFSPEHHTWTPWQLADPLCTYLFSFLAIYSTWPILKESVFLLLDASHN